MRVPMVATAALAVIVLGGALIVGFVGGGEPETAADRDADPAAGVENPAGDDPLPHADDDVDDDAPFGHHRRTQVQACEADPDCDEPPPAHEHPNHPGGGPPDHAGPPDE